MSISKSFADAAEQLGHTEALKKNNEVQTTKTINSLEELKTLSRLFVSPGLVEHRKERIAAFFKNNAVNTETGSSWIRRIESYIYADHPLSEDDIKKAGTAFPMELKVNSLLKVCLGVNEGWDLGTSTSPQFFIVNELVMNQGSYLIVRNTNLH